MNYIYLDYAATTPVDPKVLRAFTKTSRLYPGNPNSGHALGLQASEEIKASLGRMRRLLKLPKTYELTPTSGASESNNLALKGIAFQYQHQGKHIITTSFEHSSIIATANYLARLGFDISIAPTDDRGQIDLTALEALIRRDTILISIGSINSEVGIHQPIDAIRKLLKNYPHVYFHVDATQSIGKEPFDLTGIDLISLTAHKFFGLKGVGLLIKHQRVQLTPTIHGGHSTTVSRRGTPATELILSMEVALKLALKNLPTNATHVASISKYALDKMKGLPHIIINNHVDDLPHIINLSIIGHRSTDIVNYMSERGIYISNHTACESDQDVSSAILALTHDEARALSSIRLSLAHLTSREEIDIFCEVLRNYCA